ncbi:MAG TPA: hypothetical protein VKY85_25125 [Candidatus Angelobacter sp.]|nr:hypothetical protein [Candidatus Angelobacter sp.]
MLKQRCICLSLFVLFCAAITQAANNRQVDPQVKKNLFKCPNNTGFCTDIQRTYQEALGHYTGHDEPAILFYSDRSGAGNSLSTTLSIPTDPPTPPQQNGTGGTFNFQLHPAFWFGMVLCDTQSSPNFTHVCNPDTDANIFEDPDPNSRHFVGHHPGAAVMELQFYPPGGLNTCSDPALWCAALTIDSFNFQDLTNTPNNADCRNRIGLEPINFAFLTTTGVAQSAADPLNPNVNAQFTVIPGTTFQMNPGDRVRVTIHDTPNGIRTVVEDLTTGSTGSMTASIANGFAQVNFVPDPDPAHPSVTCTSAPYAFHPMYSTSSERTRATWAAHTINNSFSDEIGHYELCAAVDHEGGNCIVPSPADPGGPDFDDQIGGCFSGAFAALFGLQPIGACIVGDFDFDSAGYKFTWPGTGAPSTDALLKPSPIRFTSPRFRQQGDEDGNDRDDRRGGLHDFARVAFETDMPINEFLTNPNCDFVTGNGCTNPPAGDQFYPIYSTTRGHDRDDGVCSWQLGGPNIPGTENNFGGTSTTEYGGPLQVLVILPIDATHPNGSSTTIVPDFRQVIPHNPCRHDGHDD